MIEGATGKFLLQQMAAVAELEAGMISARTKAALAAAKRRGVKLGGDRGARLTAKARAAGRAAVQERARKAGRWITFHYRAPRSVITAWAASVGGLILQWHQPKKRPRRHSRTKAIFARFGIRTFRPTLRKAEEKLKGLRTAEGSPLPENTRTELCRHLTRLRVVREQIRAVEQERLRKLEAMRRALPELLKLDRYERRASAVPRYAHQLHGHVSHAVFKREIS
jgi:hypothetical protein